MTTNTNTRTPYLSAQLAAKDEALRNIASIMQKKRESDDSTMHAGNTSFISVERWAEGALSLNCGNLILERLAKAETDLEIEKGWRKQAEAEQAALRRLLDSLSPDSGNEVRERLEKLEAERDNWREQHDNADRAHFRMVQERDAALAELAAVKVERDELQHIIDCANTRGLMVFALAAFEALKPTTQPRLIKNEHGETDEC